jgi:Arc/MetJ-type ribon-helix-helix transcriptional regulator
VKQKVASGLDNNASDVIREARRYEVQREAFAILQAEVAKGFTQIGARQVVTCDMAKAEHRARQNSRRGRTVNPLVTP